MSDLEFTGGFDISEALQNVDSLGDALQSRIDEALGNINVESFVSTVSAAAADALSTPVTVEADASAIPGEVEAALAGSAAAIPVDADTAPAETAVSALVADVGSQNPEITVDANTEDAQQSVDDLSSASGAAQDSLSGASGATTALSSASSLATGSVSALSDTAGNLATKAGGVGGAIGATIGVLGAFTLQAINSQGGVQRLTDAMGPLADQINTIQVGNLNSGLSDLAIQTGSSATEMRNAAVDAFHLQESFGRSSEESTTFAASILALSSRAVALNPALGSAGQTADGLIRALSSGRDKALIPFDLGLTSVEINARAADIALANGRDTVTSADKAFAGAALAVEKLGGRLKQDIDEGSKNPIIQVRALGREFSSMTTEIGKPLVVPAIETLRDLKPVVGDVLGPLGQLASGVLPPLASALSFLGPAIGPVAVGFVAMKVAGAGLETIFALPLVGAQKLIEVLPLTASATVAAEEGIVAAATGMQAALGPVGILAGIAGAAFVLFGSDAEKGAGQLDSFTQSVIAANGALDETSVKAVEALLRERNQTDDLARAGIQLSDVLTGVKAAGSDAQGSLEQYGRTTAQGGDTASVRARAERDLIGALKEQDPALAAVVQKSINAGTFNRGLADTLVDLASRYHEAKGKADDLAASGAGQAEATAKQTAANQDNVTSLEDQQKAVDDYVKALDDQARAMDEIQNRLLGLPGAQLNQAQAVRDQAKAQQEYNDAVRIYGPEAANAAGLGLALDGANQKLAGSTLALYAAQTDFNKIVEQSPDHIQAEIDRLVAAASVSPQAAAALQPYIDQLVAIKQKADDLQGLTATVTVHADISGALLALDTVRGQVLAAGGNPAGAYSPGLTPELAAYLGSLEPRAAGGPVVAGRPYLVNEETPNSEIFVPDVGGTIYPASFAGTATSKTWSGGGMGGEAPITIGKVVLEQASPNPTRETVRAMRQLRRGAAMASLG